MTSSLRAGEPAFDEAAVARMTGGAVTGVEPTGRAQEAAVGVGKDAEAAERRAAAGVVEAERAQVAGEERGGARHVAVAVQHEVTGAAQAQEERVAQAQLVREGQAHAGGEQLG